MTANGLGHRESFRLGALEISPSSCEIAGGGERINVEPRVMQVLVALADAKGATVTRDDLIRLCWDGRFVGEDSINRVVLKIRQIARGIGRDSFELQTIKKVGYRLREVGTEEAKTLSQQPVAPTPARLRWSRAYLAGAAMIALLGFVGLRAMDGDASSRPAPPVNQGAKALEPAARDLAMRGAAASFEQTAAQQPQAIRYFRAALDRSPDSPSLWGSLALNYVLVLPYTAPQDQPAVLSRVSQAARRSLQLNPGEGHALAAATYLQPTYGNWIAKERLFRAAIAQSDQGSPAPSIHYVRFLTSVGRTAEALRIAEQVMQVHPLVPWLNVNLVQLLQANGRLEDAERAAERAGRLWPRNHDLWHARFFLLLFDTSPAAALAMADDRANWPEGVREGDMLLLRRLALAVQQQSPAGIDAVLADYANLAAQGQTYAEHAMLVAQRLGRPDAALRLAERLYLAPNPPAISKRFRDHHEYVLVRERPTAALFLNGSEALWADPRFPALADRMGLVAYWRSNGAPDLCQRPKVRASCDRMRPGPEVARLAGSAASPQTRSEP